jgi:hypothetical protein
VDDKQSDTRERYYSRRPRSSGTHKQGEIREHFLGYGVALGSGFGMAIGTSFGAAFGNLAVGMGFGICLGVSLGIAVGSILGKKHTKAVREPSDRGSSRDA